ncbi:Nitric oxide synthase, inducible [Halotydeus destructor]|nr:Nitric oxide synthase, inducible [Halotydeus destructor]
MEVESLVKYSFLFTNVVGVDIFNMRLVDPSDKPEVDADPQLVTANPDEDKPKVAQTLSKAVVKVTNLVNSKQLTDKLHHQAKSSPCPAHHCLGALMQNSGEGSRSIIRSKTQIIEQAIEFMEQYFIYKKQNNEHELSARLAEISKELELNGSYSLTADELAFGARTAWRNASRCIGRIQWNNLHMFDKRHVQTTREMFDALCEHIAFATNNGNIRSCITIFPQRVPGREDFRLWNPQLIAYAGYMQADGSIVGDPARVSLTRICEKLGWKGSGGQFDVLPLILSAPGEGAQLYEIPKELVLEVEFEHPKYEWFKELNLKWYCLPAVSDMLFDVGGMEFPAAPFNGWYMGTEIGARDLCDEQRYNLLNLFGEKLGLDMESSQSLWKDEVLVEVNKAVLYSFAKRGITIVDHHTASQSFMQHMQNETKARGGCPADWVWVVPPMSGSATAVYHQEMVNYHLKPSFEYQERAWKGYKWKKVELKWHLSTVAKAVLCTVRIMGGILSQRVKATILFATETGRSEMFADKLVKKLAASFYVRKIRMDEYNFGDLQSEKLLFVVASTFGNGDPPDNGKPFWKNLYNNCRHKQTNQYSLNGLVFSIFGLGSSLYPTFGAFGKNLDKTLRELGGKSLKPVTTGDELKGQEKLFSVWSNSVYSKSLKTFGLVTSDDEDSEEEIVIGEKEAFAEEVFDPTRHRVKSISGSSVFNEQTHMAALSKIHGEKRYPHLFPMSVISRVRLQPRNNVFGKQSLLVRLHPNNPLAVTRLNYVPGDHLGVFPSNPPALVEALIGHLTQSRAAFADLEDAILQVELKDEGWSTMHRLPPCTLREAFTNYLDITSPPGQRFLASMSLMANDSWDSFRLKKLSQEPDEYRKWRTFHFPNMLDVLNEFPSVRVTPEFLLARLPLLAPRLYSISSSLRANPDEVHLTMSLVSFSTHQDPQGPKKQGVCTSFFDRFPEKPVPCFIRSAPGFRLPDDPSLPIILIGAGSGIAPFRSFWQEREVMLRERGGKGLGKCILFFGCRSKKVDYVYQQELTTLLRRGVVHEVFLALSREENHKKRHVQDEVFAQRSLLYWILEREGGHIYVCGDAQMADGVRKSLLKVFTTEGGSDEAEAQNAVDDLLNQNRYHEDVFGAIHSFY